MEQILITKKIESLENELHNLKSIVLQKNKKTIPIRGMLKGINISEKEISRAKKSIFK